VRGGELVAFVAPGRIEREQYAAALARLADSMTILPVRFGSHVAGAAAVRSLLSTRGLELRAALRRVHGALELALRASWIGDRARPGSAAPASGTSYLRDRLAALRRAEAIAQRLAPLSGLAREHTLRAPADPRTAVAGAYLVERERVEAFCEEVARLDQRLADAALSCTGPWPPYSFSALVGDPEEASAA
jgi:hypothetical protein